MYCCVLQKSGISVLEEGGEAGGSKTGSFTKLLHIPKDSNLISPVTGLLSFWASEQAMFVSIPSSTDIILYMKRLPAPPEFKHCISQAGWRWCFNTWGVQQIRMIKYLQMWRHCPEISVKFQRDLILGRIMMITNQQLNVDHNRNMCYSGEWYWTSGFKILWTAEPAQSWKILTEFCMGTKRKELGQIKARNVITACKITDWT